MFNPDGTFQREGTKHISQVPTAAAIEEEELPQLDVIDIFRLESSCCRVLSPAFVSFFFFGKKSRVEMDPKLKPEIGLEVDWEI